MERKHIRRLAGLVVAGAVFLGVTGLTAAPASAAKVKTKTFKTKASFTTSSIAPDGSFEAAFVGSTSSGASTNADLTGVTTAGPKKVTKTLVTLTNVPLGTSGVANGFTEPVNAPWLTGTLTGTVDVPPGFDPSTARIKEIIVKCHCDWSNASWGWDVIIVISASTA
jgi:hypothetical protein